MNSTSLIDEAELWQMFQREAQQFCEQEPMLAPYLQRCILGHSCFSRALACMLSRAIGADLLPGDQLFTLIIETINQQPSIVTQAMTDLQAHVDRDPASDSYLVPFLYFKGYQALQLYRIANVLWNHGRQPLALYLQSRSSIIFDVDIHPAATIGKGVMLDHGSGLVIGETAVVEDDVSILHGVTLGGTGKEMGDRHPKIRRGVLLAAGARILGNIEVGEGAKVGASSLVLYPVEPHTTVAGVPAKVVGRPKHGSPALNMEQKLNR